MSLMADYDIAEAIMQGRIKIDPFNNDQLQPASYNCTLAPDILIWNDKVLDRIKPLDPKKDNSFEMHPLVIPEVGYELQPGHSILASTVEWFAFGDDVVGRLEGRSSLARLMLLVHVTAGYVDPGFKGNITIEIVNLNRRSIILYPGMKIAQMAFEKTITSASRPYGHVDLHSKYQDSQGAVDSRIHRDWESNPSESDIQLLNSGPRWFGGGEP